jgi:hypothetical protein
MRSPELERIDFAKSHKDLYSATSKVKEILADKATFRSEGPDTLDGQGGRSRDRRHLPVVNLTKTLCRRALVY